MDVTEFKTLLGSIIQNTEGREVYTVGEVQDLLLDLWLLLDDDSEDKEEVSV